MVYYGGLKMSRKLSQVEFEDYKERLIIFVSNIYCVPQEDVRVYFDKIINQENPIDDKSRYELIFTLRSFATLHFSNPFYERDLEVVLIGHTRRNDFGKLKKIKERLQVFKINPQKAIEDSLTNDKGEVLEKNHYNNKVKIINKVNVFSKTFYGITKIGNKLKPISIELVGEQSKIEIPLFQKVKITNVQSKNTDKAWANAKSTDNTSIQIISDEDVNIEKYLKYFQKELNLSINKIENPNTIEKDIKFFIKKATISQIKEVENNYVFSFVIHENKENKLEEIEKLDNVKAYDGYLDKIPKNFKSGEGYIIGNTFNKTKDGSLGFNIYGVYITKPYSL